MTDINKLLTGSEHFAEQGAIILINLICSILIVAGMLIDSYI